MCCGNITVETVANLFNIADVPDCACSWLPVENSASAQPEYWTTCVERGDELIPFTLMSGPNMSFRAYLGRKREIYENCIATAGD